MHGVYLFVLKTYFSWRIHFSFFRCSHTLTHLYKVWSRVVVIITENITTKLCCACLVCRDLEESARGAAHHLTVSVDGTTSQLRLEYLPLTGGPNHCHPLCHQRVSNSSRLFSTCQVLSGVSYAYKEVVSVQTPKCSPNGILAAL